MIMGSGHDRADIVRRASLNFVQLSFQQLCTPQLSASIVTLHVKGYCTGAFRMDLFVVRESVRLIVACSSLIMATFNEDPKRLCWRPQQALIECVAKTKCFEEHKEIEKCLVANQCYLERKNWILCKTNSVNPRYRLRGNPYDVASEDQKRIEARDARIRKRQMEAEGLDLPDAGRGQQTAASSTAAAGAGAGGGGGATSTSSVNTSVPAQAASSPVAAVKAPPEPVTAAPAGVQSDAQPTKSGGWMSKVAGVFRRNPAKPSD